jgi:heavy metal efflux system protein
MFDRIIWFSLKNKFLILLVTLAIVAYGIYSATNIPVDAVPDITNNQVQVVTTSPSLAPQEVEQFITYPVEIAMANIPGAIEIRSISRYGLSVVTIVFDEEISTLNARQYVGEQIKIASENIPTELGSPELMPITTGLGEIYQYILAVDKNHISQYSPLELRSIQDWIVKRQLSGIKGIVEVSSFGGFLKQYEVAVDPLVLESYNISIKDIFDALEKNNQNSGGSYIEKGPNAFYIRSEGLIKSLDDLKNIVVETRNGNPIYIKNVGEVRFGSAQRFGAMTMDGQGETVGGITLMLKGANSSEAIENVKNRVTEIQETLPEGVSIYPYLDRSVLVSKTIKTVITNLIEGGLIVIFVLIILLGNWRSGIVVASVIPLAMLFALIMMRLNGVSANLMSLGAIDFGIVVDGAVIIVESILHTLFANYKGQKLSQNQMDDVVYSSTKKLFKSAAFGVFIILVVFIPILTLDGIEGKMFLPMAQTVSFAILGALIFSITYVPVVSSLLIGKNISSKETIADKIINFIQKFYGPSLKFALSNPKLIVISSGLALVITIFGFSKMGGEFLPTLEEGDLAMQMTIQPGSSLSESINSSTKAEKILMDNFPEVKHVISKIGTAEVPTDPMAIEDADIMIILKDKDEWVSAASKDEMVEKMKEKLTAILGASFEFSQPIQLRFNELITGSKADIAVNIFGDDLEKLSKYGNKAGDLIKEIKGAADVKVEQTEGFPQLMVNFNRAKLAQYGLNIQEVNKVIRAAYAGEIAGTVFEGEKRFDLVVRLNPEKRSDFNLDNLFIHTPTGQKVHLAEVCDVEFKEGPMQISREQTMRKISIGVNIRDRDIASLVEEIQTELSQKLNLPPGYIIKYGGQFENLQHAQQRLGIAVPIALVLIFIFLFMAFGSIKNATLIFSAVPLSAIGGVGALYLRGMPFSISAGIGFIALFGVAVLNGIVLLSYIVELEKKGEMKIKELIQLAGASRLRPVIMTAAVASLGFLPMALSSSEGAEVQKPLATVVIGGLITATLLTLIVLPVLYYISRNKVKLSGPPQLNTILVIGLLLGSFSLSIGQNNPYPSQMNEHLQKVTEQNAQIKNINLQSELSVQKQKGSLSLNPTNVVYQYGQINSSIQDYNWQITQNFGSIPAQLSQKKLYKEEEKYFDAVSKYTQVDLEKKSGILYLEAWKIKSILNQLDTLKLELTEFDSLNTLKYNLGEISLTEKTYASNFIRELDFNYSNYFIDYQDILTQLKVICNCEEEINFPQERFFAFVNSNETKVGSEVLIAPFSAVESQKLAEAKTYKGNYFPEISLGYFNQQLDGVEGFDGVLLGVNVPIWYKPTKSKIKGAELEAEIAKNNTENQLLKINAERNSINNKIESFYPIMQSNKENLEQSNILTKASNISYKSGEIDVWRHINNLNQALKSKIQYLETINKFNQLVVLQNFYNN